MNKHLDFQNLVEGIVQVHQQAAAQASRAVNVSLTLRNWAIGCYIQEYEQYGADRAEYGEELLEKLAKQLKNSGLKGLATRNLWYARRFYQFYPQIVQTLSAELSASLPNALDQKILQPASAELRHDGHKLLNRLSFSHFVELIPIEDPLARVFYEMESMRGNWSVRELKRQIGSLLFERSALSKNKQKLSELVQARAESAPAHLDVRDPYVFEFLGIKPEEVMGESEVEDQLLHKLQGFLLELGHGFCFEARQKRILIGDAQYFVDLVFYHRILKCHVLVELKLRPLNHENIGQLNTYVSWYRKNMMTEGDNPPIGILLCTEKNHALMEYALAGMDNQLFVSKYQLELPKKEDMQRFIDAALEDSQA